jgi:GntR family transcriptional repressor for pyruvate dehydrogenase complex
LGMAPRKPKSNPGDRTSPLRTIKRTQRNEEVRRQIEDAIKGGDFAPGERLPSERELVETFGVSRVSVREAIRSLEAIGLVRVYHGRGVFVTDRRSGLGEPMARWLDRHRDEVLELLGVRGALDEYAAALAAENHDAAKIAAITAAHEAFAAAVENEASAGDLVPLDIDLHVAIAEASGNRLLYDLLSDLHSYLAESRYLALVLPGRPARSAAEHAEIVAAIATGDAAAARLATGNHIAGVRQVVVAGMHADREQPRPPGSSRLSGAGV